MIKIIGAALIVVTCTGLGLQMAKAYRDRPKHVSELAHAIRLLRTEIEYRLTPLPQAFHAVSARTSAPISRAFQAVSERMAEGDTARAAFSASLARLQEQSALQRDDLDVLTELASTLGMSDLAHQSQHLDIALARLSTLEQDARALQRKNERMWQYLGVLAGLLLVVILY